MPEDFTDMILHGLSADTLKNICRKFSLKGFSKLKKAELAEFIHTSLSQEELSEIMNTNGQESIAGALSLGADIASGKEIREKLIRVTDNAEEILLNFKGLQWTQEATVKEPKTRDSLPEWTCTCRTAQDGGICPHFYVAIAALSQLRNWSAIDLPSTLCPDGCAETLTQMPVKLFLAGGENDEGAVISGGIYKDCTEILRGFFLDYGSNNLTALERRSKEELIAFVGQIAPDLPIDPDRKSVV